MEIQVFRNSLFGEIRTTGSADNPLFCLSDVCKAVGLTTNGISRRLSGDVISNHPISDNFGRVQKALFVNEDGLYDVILDSRKAEARKFRKWITSEVLPSIRRQGGYMVAKVEETPEQLMARALTIANATLQRQNAMLADMEKKNMALTMANETLAEKNSESEQVIEQLKPGAAFANAVATSAQSCLIGELAVILKQNGVDIGQNRLFEWMRKNGYLCSSANLSRYNQPTQKAMDLQLFEIKKTTITMPSGETIVKVTPKVTGKGQIYFVNKFLYNSASGKAQKPSGDAENADR